MLTCWLSRFNTLPLYLLLQQRLKYTVSAEQCCYSSTKSKTAEFKKPSKMYHWSAHEFELNASQISCMVRFLLLACESVQDLRPTYTSQTQKALCRCLETNRKSFKRLVKLLDETFRDSQSVTNVFRMLHPAPCDWQQDKVRMGVVSWREGIKRHTHQKGEKWGDKRGKTSINLFSNSLLRLY